MKVRELIEILAKNDWNSQIKIDSRTDVPPSEFCNTKDSKQINSVTHFTSGKTSYVMLNTRKL